MQFEHGRMRRKAEKLVALAAMGRIAGECGGWRGGGFGSDGPFGPGGPFGPKGPFGGGGPFGRDRHGGSGDGFGGDGGPGRGRRRFDRAGLRLVLLRLIAAEPRHGYDLIKAIEELSGGHYAPSPGAVYPTLAMLADEGLIAEQASADQRRKFAITDAGQAALAAEAEQAEAAVGRLEQLAQRAERGRAPAVERAAANLFMAVAQRMRAERPEGSEIDAADLPHRIAEILDDTARRIERL